MVYINLEYHKEGLAYQEDSIGPPREGVVEAEIFVAGTRTRVVERLTVGQVAASGRVEFHLLLKVNK